ncbi:hypothetical protein ACOTWC_05965 [Aliarcobacter butzleri]
MMKIVFFVLLCASINLFADNYVNGYYKSNGTYVNGYTRSSSNSTKSDNFSTYGNVNPYTGKEGTKIYDDYNNYGRSNSNSNSNYNSSGYKNTYGK